MGDWCSGIPIWNFLVAGGYKMGLISVTYGISFDGANEAFFAFCGSTLDRKAATRYWLVAGFFLLLSANMLAQARHDAGDVALVGNGDLPLANLSLYDVRRVFLGETRYWKSNLPVVLIVPPAGTRERDVLLRRVYRMNEAQYKQYWIGRILRGEAVSAPKIAASHDVTNELVAHVPGCITIMNVGDVNATGHLKILRVDDKSPGDKEYALR